MNRPIQTEFEFSFKTYSSKVYTTFLKDAVLLIRKPTKLVLHVSDFSVIFYDFYKALDLFKKKARIYLKKKPCKDLCIHNHTLISTKQSRI
jgi:hypothetical protein